MFTSIQHFKQSFESEMKFSSGIMGALTDASLGQAVNKDHRTIGRIAWHIITTYPEMAGQIGIEFSGVGKDDPMPTTAAPFKDAYDKVSGAVLEYVTANWTDETLLQFDDLYGDQWEKGRTLFILIKHEAHHRGQMTVLMRQAGLKFPDIYGPTLEGWPAYGGTPPAV